MSVDTIILVLAARVNSPSGMIVECLYRLYLPLILKNYGPQPQKKRGEPPLGVAHPLSQRSRIYRLVY